MSDRETVARAIYERSKKAFAEDPVTVAMGDEFFESVFPPWEDTDQDPYFADADAAIAAMRPAIRAKALEEAARCVDGKCCKCSGEGWLWAHELERSPYPDNRSPRSDDTKYSCDGEQHEVAAAIRALKTSADASGS